MPLDEYLAREGLTQSVFAERIGRNQSTIHRLLHGATPDLQTLKRIIDATGGAVGIDDFVGAE